MSVPRNKLVLLFLAKSAMEKFEYTQLTRIQLVKILFLLEKKLYDAGEERLTDYVFEMTETGPYSADVINDIEELVEVGWLSRGDRYNQYQLENLSPSLEHKVDEIRANLEKTGQLEYLQHILEIGRNQSKLLEEASSAIDDPNRNHLLE